MAVSDIESKHFTNCEVSPVRVREQFGNLVSLSSYLIMWNPADDGSGLPFDSILGLRSLKIRNFLGMKNFSNVKAFHPVRYEDMVRNGTAQLIQNLENDLKVVAKCQPIKGEPEKGTRPMLYEYVEYMKSHVDWETEALAGYGPNDMM